MWLENLTSCILALKIKIKLKNFGNNSLFVIGDSFCIYLHYAKYVLIYYNLHFAGSLYPFVILAQAVSQPFNVAHSAKSCGPAALWIAPSTIIYLIITYLATNCTCYYKLI